MWQWINPTADIALISVGVALISMALQVRFTDRKKMKSLQKDMKERQKKMRELAGKTDGNSIAELKKLEQEMTQALSESMKHSMQSMMKVLPLSLPLILVWFVLAANYSLMAIWIPFPFTLVKSLWAFITPGTTLNTIGWVWWYVICAFVASIVINAVLTRIEERLEAKHFARQTGNNLGGQNG